MRARKQPQCESMLLLCCLSALCEAEDHVYTVLKAPTAWRAPETFLSRAAGKEGTIASTASDVFMLGCCYLELATKCSRLPYDWLGGEDLLVFRKHAATRCVGPVQVQLLYAVCCMLYVVMLSCCMLYVVCCMLYAVCCLDIVLLA